MKKAMMVFAFLTVILLAVPGAPQEEFFFDAKERVTGGVSGDIDGNGTDDLLVFVYDMQNKIGKAYLFKTRNIVYADSGHTFDKAKICDLNDDGIPDLLIFSQSVSTSPGKVIGFLGPINYSNMIPNFRIVGGHSDFAEDGAVGDMNDDGKEDILVMVDDRFIEIYSTDQLADPVTVIRLENRLSLSSMEVGDVNQDGKDDLIVGLPLGTAKGITHIFCGPIRHGDLAITDASYSFEGNSQYEQFGAIPSIIDGKVVISSTNYIPGVYETGGSKLGLYQETTLLKEVVGPSDSLLIMSLHHADVDNDGYLDLLVGTPFNNGLKGGIFILRGPDYIFDPDYSIKGIVDREALGFFTLTGDYNKDGFLDIAIGFLNFAGKGFMYSGGIRVLYSMQSHIGRNADIPENYSLSQNYPNPFNSDTTIKFAIPADEHVAVSIYNLLGQKIETLIDKHYKSGTHRINWSAEGYPSGVYFYRITTDNWTQACKLTLVK